MTRRVAAIAALTLAVAGLATGCGSSSSGGGTAAQQATPTGTSTDAAGCTTPPKLQQNPQHYTHEPALTIARTTYTATIVTNCGTITVALDGKAAPRTVNSFVFLASKGYFNDTACLRLTDPKYTGIAVLQCGDPSETGRGGPGYTLPDENLKGAKYTAGTVAMANTGTPHSGGSQFFFIYGPTKLSPSYTPFGRITSGLDVLTRIAARGEDNSYGQGEGLPQGDGHPTAPVIIESFTVTKG